jgi:F0F1-type ATP synthase epsilon subunit
VLVEEAIDPQRLDRATIETKLSEARGSAERAPEDSEERARALRDIRRYEAFLAVGE